MKKIKLRSNSKTKLITIRIHPILYNAIHHYANYSGIENVSTTLRHLIVTQLRKEGYIKTSETLFYKMLEE